MILDETFDNVLRGTKRLYGIVDPSPLIQDDLFLPSRWGQGFSDHETDGKPKPEAHPVIGIRVRIRVIFFDNDMMENLPNHFGVDQRLERFISTGDFPDIVDPIVQK